MLDLKNILSCILFSVFLTAYITKLILLYKNAGIRANVLAKGGKQAAVRYTEVFVKITTFIWGGAWLLQSAGQKYTAKILGQFTDNWIIGYAGIIVTGIGLAIFVWAMASMKTSWRVGIDKKTKTRLVTEGIYSFSRNPAFVGFDCMFLGTLLIYPNSFNLLLTILNFLSIHMLIKQEEKHLEETFGESYMIYSGKTPRYLLF